MNHHYKDIRDKLGEPSWWDEYAVPRYCEFSPDETANIYAREAALVEIACQSCEATFRVCMTSSTMDLVRDRATLSQLIERCQLHYGDPPNAGCCPAGPTMNSVPLRVLEFWDKTNPSTVVRRPDLEREIDCEWAA